MPVDTCVSVVSTVDGAAVFFSEGADVTSDGAAVDVVSLDNVVSDGTVSAELVDTCVTAVSTVDGAVCTLF